MKKSILFFLGLILLITPRFGAVAQDDRGDVAALVKVARGDQGVIQLPIRFHIVRGAGMTKKGVDLEMWLSVEDVRGAVLEEINRIWGPGGIQWVIESVVEEQVADVANQRGLVEGVSVATRETKDRKGMISKLIDDANHHPVIHNLYFFPYMGETSQGFASFGGGARPLKNPDGGNRAVVGVWTDKPSRAKKKPRRFGLTETPPFKIGSIGRTCAHELGHNLLLRHPDKQTQTVFDRLMGGKRAGYALTPEEIALARTVARGRAETIVKWATRER